MNILCVGIKSSQYGGYYSLHIRNIELLKDISDNCYFYDIESVASGSLMHKLIKGFVGNYFRLNEEILNELYLIIEEKKINVVFVAHSLCSYVSYVVKNRYKNSIKVITYFHNCEYCYFKGEVQLKPFNLISILHMLFAYKTEKLSILYSDYIWGLNERDNHTLYKYYNRKFDLILPMSIKDSVGNLTFREPNKRLKLLFVGSDFYANVYGLNWFIVNVSQFVNCDLIVVGNGMEKYEFPYSNVSVVGFVENISPYYLDADLVVSPIFHGSGMKTKIAEAMMYSKPILGTTEAFEGYDIDFGRIGGLCNTAKDFINKIHQINMNRSILRYFSSYSREQFVNKFEYNQTLLATKNFIKDELVVRI